MLMSSILHCQYYVRKQSTKLDGWCLLLLVVAKVDPTGLVMFVDQVHVCAVRHRPGEGQGQAAAPQSGNIHHHLLDQVRGQHCRWEMVSSCVQEDTVTAGSGALVRKIFYEHPYGEVLH